MHQGPETWPRKGGIMNRVEQLAARLAGIMAELDPYGQDLPDAEELKDSLTEDPLATVEFLMDAVEILMA